jgi:L-ascorbate metabolism protein UlaG (beta-lactamase superfamily)
MKHVIQVFALVCLVAISACAQAKKTGPLKTDELSKPVAVKPGTNLTIRYIANEGVLIASAGKQILIDGLHREYKADYLFPPPEMQAVLENARPPYEKIDFLLVSHFHLDHFHPESIGLYLKGNPRSIFASSSQAVDEVSRNFGDYEKVRSQIRPITHEWKKSSEMDQDGVKIKFLGLRHSGERFKDMQNLGHLITIGGKKLLHIGDADMTAENFSAFNLAGEKIDVAFIPYWFLISDAGRTFVREQFNPKNIIAVHIPPAEAEQVIAQLKKDLPKATAFTRILEERSY